MGQRRRALRRNLLERRKALRREPQRRRQVQRRRLLRRRPQRKNHQERKNLLQRKRVQQRKKPPKSEHFFTGLCRNGILMRLILLMMNRECHSFRDTQVFVNTTSRL